MAERPPSGHDPWGVIHPEKEGDPTFVWRVVKGDKRTSAVKAKAAYANLQRLDPAIVFKKAIPLLSKKTGAHLGMRLVFQLPKKEGTVAFLGAMEHDAVASIDTAPPASSVMPLPPQPQQFPGNQPVASAPRSIAKPSPPLMAMPPPGTRSPSGGMMSPPGGMMSPPGGVSAAGAPMSPMSPPNAFLTPPHPRAMHRLQTDYDEEEGGSSAGFFTPRSTCMQMTDEDISCESRTPPFLTWSEMDSPDEEDEDWDPSLR